MNLECSPTLLVPSGTFRIGACSEDKYANDTEQPARHIDFAVPFEMSSNPVTVSEWGAFDPGHDPTSPGDLPVTGVFFRDVQRYLEWRNLREWGHGSRPCWRLPTEEEWEYACRAGTESIFHTGDQLEPDAANFLFDESLKRVGPGTRTPVGKYPPNPWGLHDFHGNVAEWTSSPWKPDLRPATPAAPGRHTIRGGAWDLLPRLLRSSWRDGADGAARRDNLGFRIARDLG